MHGFLLLDFLPLQLSPWPWRAVLDTTIYHNAVDFEESEAQGQGAEDPDAVCAPLLRLRFGSMRVEASLPASFLIALLHNLLAIY